MQRNTTIYNIFYFYIYLKIIYFVQVFWSENGELLCISSEDSFFILRYNPEALTLAKSTNATIPEDGFEESFDVCKSLMSLKMKSLLYFIFKLADLLGFLLTGIIEISTQK